MTPIGVTQRLTSPNEHGETRTALDVRWPTFLERCGLVCVPLPNDPGLAVPTARRLRLGGVLFTGGEDLASYGGPARQRDETERALLRWAIAAELPVLGVCRGMQLIVDHFGGLLRQVPGHVRATRSIVVNGVARRATCYHAWAAVNGVPAPLTVSGAVGPVVEAVDHPSGRIKGIMWHPEREETPQVPDVELFRTHLGGST
ncbi:gamma-glutamyl-gamma-aminobutyrate hydrolase family protein [Streptomyces sp. 4N509B]|uniref:gamma-glutamyl-gamma-aminobutyrate hydrolase family protein n=1 Tax=Streptomyces sp. 4N509B TaxID=3457413 RepID=UPI003FD349B6